MKRPTDDNSNRVRSVIDGVIGTEDPDDLMLELLGVLQEGGKVPESGKYYVFVYNPKTPNIQYDQNPFVAVTDVFSWGFRGINFHWGERRNYSWFEITSVLYEIRPDEIGELRNLNYAKIRTMPS